MKIPKHKIDEIKDSVSIEDVVGDYVTLSRKGERFWGRCPFHQEKTASFTVTPDKGLFYCFGCQKGGSVFTFIQDIENCSFVESVEILARKGGINLEFIDDGMSSERKKKIELNNKVAKSFQYILREKKEAEGAFAYLSGRNIDNDSIDRFKIGWAPADKNWLWKFLRSKSYSEEFLEDSGFFSKNNRYPLFTARIMFPILSIRGDIIGFGGRTLQEKGSPKYINSPESDIFKKGNTLFGLNLAIETIRKSKSCVLVEGYTDVIALHQAGFTDAVAPLGTALTEKQAELLERYVEKAILMFDGDEAGKKATMKAISILEQAGIETFVVNFKNNEDPAEFLQQNGVQALKILLDYPISSFEYVMEAAFTKYSGNSPSNKEAACWDVFQYINNSKSEIRRSEFLKKLSEKAEIDILSIWKDFQNRKKSGADRKDYKKQDNRRAVVATDLYLMIAVSVNVDYFSRIRTELESKDLETPEAKELFIALEENFRLENLDTQSVIERINNNSVKRLITESVSTGEFSGNIDSIIRDSVRQIKRKDLILRQKQIIEKIRKAEESGKQTDLQELLEEKIFIDDEIKKSRVEGNVESAD